MKVAIKLAAVSMAVASMSFAQIASDSGSNYSGGWTNGSNGGTGFGAWAFNHSQGTGAAGTFIGDPASAGIGGMSTTSFGFFANPDDSGANAEVARSFSSALNVGETFSFQWGLNWDSDNPGSNRGFNLFSDGGTVQEINMNMENTSEITINGSTMFANFGTNAFTVNMELQAPTTLRVFGTGRDGTETFDDTFTVAGAPDSFSMYFNATDDGVDERQMYADNFEVIPEPGTMALLGIGILGLAGLRRRLS